MRLSDRTVIATGGAAGIGATYAAGLVHEGAVVYIADVADGSSLAAGLSGRGPGSAVFVRTDIGDEDSVRSLVRMVIEDRGRIDVLVNNAALFAALPPVSYDQISLELWDRVMRVNLAGTFLMCKHVGPYMAAQNSGRIINIGSGTSLKGHPGMLHYVSSKGAITALTRTVARELGSHNVCVNTLSPGFTLSDTVVGGNPSLVEGREGTERRHPVGTTRHAPRRSSQPPHLPGVRGQRQLHDRADPAGRRRAAQHLTDNPAHRERGTWRKHRCTNCC